MLADAGIIEDIPRARARPGALVARHPGRPARARLRLSLSPADRAALNEWRAGQIPGELDLFNRFIRDYRRHGRWAKASRAGGYYTAEDLDALFDDYAALIHKYGHSARERPARGPGRCNCACSTSRTEPGDQD